MTELNGDWRLIDGVETAWFDAPSLTKAAALAERVLDVSDQILVDIRVQGVRVHLDSDAHSEPVSAAARDVGLVADPSVLQQLSVVLESSHPRAVGDFWRRALDYAFASNDDLIDPLQRDPALRVRPSTKSRPLRNRVHLDVVRPAALVEQAELGEATGPFGVRHVDPDGNEVDLVPGGPLDESSGSADWQAVFSAMACYRVSSTTSQRELATAAATAADEVGFPLLIDVRPGLVILDSAKDQWESDGHGLDLEFTNLAATIQTAARELGATADPQMPRFVQLFLDAADVDAVKAFWAPALGYVDDRRAHLTEIHDPRRLNPELVFQQLDASETERRQQRNRTLFALAVPPDLALRRLETIVAAGGRLLEESGHRWRIADPEGNELVLIGGS